MYFVSLNSLCYVIAIAGAGGLNSRSVNVNLETVFEFDPNDNSGDVAFIDNVQQFLGKVKTVIDHKTGRTFHKRSQSSKTEKFTDFIRKGIKILKTYSDDDLEDVIAVVDDEIRKYHYQGCKFHELVQNVDLRRFVANKLSSVQNKQGKDIKKSLDNLLNALDGGKLDYRLVELLDYINSLYGNTDMDKMESFLSEIQMYAVKSKRTNLSLVSIIRNGIRNIIFDHYSNMNPNARKEFRIKIQTFWGISVETTTEATTTTKMFDIAKGFDFIRDFTFEFVTPEPFAKKSTTSTSTSKTLAATTKMPENLTQTTKVNFIDLTKLKMNNNPEEISSYSDNEKFKDKEIKEGKNKKSKVKREREKNKGHKNKKTHNKAPVIDEDFTSEPEHKHKKYKNEEAPEPKHKSKNHKNKHVPEPKHKSKKHKYNHVLERKYKSKNNKNDFIFRQHDAIKPAILDPKAVVNVKEETEESYSSELSKTNESISIERQKTTSKKKPGVYRKHIATKSEEGLSIEFKPMPMILGLKKEQTTKADATLVRRINNLEKVIKTFKSKIDKNDNIKVINDNEKISTVKITEKKQPPITKPVKLANTYNNNRYQTGEYLPNFRTYSSTIQELMPKRYDNIQTSERYYGPYQYLSSNKIEITEPTFKELNNSTSDLTKESPNTQYNDVNNNNNVERILDKLKSDNITSDNAVNMKKINKTDPKSDKNKNNNENNINTSNSVIADDSTAVEVREKLKRQMNFFRGNKKNNFDLDMLM